MVVDMKLVSYKTFYSIELFGISFDIPVNTRIITLDNNSGYIYAWITDDEIDIVEEYGFWFCNSSDAILIGKCKENTDYDWRKPLWVAEWVV